MTRVGVIGAGQLGRMLGIAGRKLDLEFTFLDPADDPPAAVAGAVISKPFDDPEALAELAHRADLLTYEFENVPVDALEAVAASTPVYPPPAALREAQDRLHEKKLLQRLQIPVADFRTVDAGEDLEAAVAELGYPVILKTRRFGYDGKGQAVIRDAREGAAVLAELGGRPLIAERKVDFDYEVSIIGARRKNGEIAVYPLTRNLHENGILRVSTAPVCDDRLAASARGYLEALLEGLDYVGVLALELFVVGDSLLANEFAPRVHNSGHWTIEGARTSQFENHLRAILDLPLGDTATTGHAGMINLIGKLPSEPGLLTRAGFRFHDYGKRPRPGRKLGHATLVAPAAAARDEAVAEALKTLSD